MHFSRSFITANLVVFALLASVSNHYWGLNGFYASLLGVGLALFFNFSTHLVLNYIIDSKLQARPGSFLIILAFFSKLPILMVACYFLMTFIRNGIIAFILGVGLVYFSLYFNGLLDARKA